MNETTEKGDVLPAVFLKARGDKRLAAGHPWAYANEIRMDGDAKALPPGAMVQLRRVDGKPLGLASFNAHALISARMFSHDAAETVDADFLARRLASALALRDRFFADPFYRLVHGEADGLPGLVIDRYGETLVCQVNTAGAEGLADDLLAALDGVLAPRVVVLRADGRGRKAEGLESYRRIAKGALEGPVEGREGAVAFLADAEHGQKTGWFFDQRDNRAFLSGLAEDARMLDLYCYQGGFALAAARAGAAETLGIDSSAPALALAERSAALNGVENTCRWRKGDVFETVAQLVESGERFDVVNADPPAFVTVKRDLGQGLRGYRKLAREAARLVAPGGLLCLASCSHHVSADAFAAETARGVAAAGRWGRILRHAGAGPDHPVHPHLPESAYLKSLVLALD